MKGGRGRINNQIADNRLVDRSIKRLDNIINTSTKIRWQCLFDNCNFIWQATPNKIFMGRGCPKCGGTLKLNNHIVDQRFLIKNIERIDNYIDNKTKINVKCLKCSHIWNVIPRNVLNTTRSCPNCAKRLPITDEIIDNRLKYKNIKRLDHCSKSRDKIRFQCLIESCLFIWTTSFDSVNRGTGCPKCAHCLLLNNEIIDNSLTDRSIARVDNYINAVTKITWMCLNVGCGAHWQARPNHILSHGSGCPVCKRKNEKLIYFIFKNHNIDFEFQKRIKDFNKTEKKRYRLDFYLPDYNIAIEYNDHQHYEPVCFFGNSSPEEANAALKKQIERDCYVSNFCIKNSIKLIIIDGRIYDKERLKVFIEDLLKDIINGNF